MAIDIKKVVQFLKEVRFELKRVTWPSRKQTLAGTVVVLIIVLIAGIYLGMVDTGLTYLIKVILGG